MSKQVKISVALATFNEEINIGACLKLAKGLADEIVIVDGNSEDKTREIAKSYGAKVIEAENQPMFHINKNLAIKNCSNSWILLLDADERLSPQLIVEIKKTINENPPQNGFWISRRNWFLGGFLIKGGVYPDSVIRLFKKGKGVLPEKSVHEQVKIDGEVGYLKNDIVHFADPQFSRYLKRSDRYSTLFSQDLRQKGVKNDVFNLFFYFIFKPLGTFGNIYIRHRGYLDGFRGFVWALFSATQYFFAYAKYIHGKKSGLLS